MKTIKTPEPIMIPDNNNGEPLKFTFKRFIEEAANQYAPFGKGAKGANNAKRIFDIVDDETKEEYSFEDFDFDNVKDTLKEVNFNPYYNKYFTPFYNAINEVKE